VVNLVKCLPIILELVNVCGIIDAATLVLCEMIVTYLCCPSIPFSIYLSAIFSITNCYPAVAVLKDCVVIAGRYGKQDLRSPS
jgi:hypothetical protein